MPPRSSTAPARPLAYTAAALLYMVVAETTATPLSGFGPVQVLQPAGGVALVLLLLGGLRFAPAIFAASLLSSLLAGDAPLAALAEALGVVTAATVACRLMQRQPSFDQDHPNFSVVRHTLLWVCGVGAGTGALASAAGHLLAGEIPPGECTAYFLQWWMGNSLGTLLVGPLLMSYRRTLRFAQPLQRLDEGGLVWLLACTGGVLIFGNTQDPVLAPLANAYWMFLFVSWSGARLGMLSTTGLVCMVALQALWGSHQRTGFFARDIAVNHGFGYWSYMMILAVVGLSLAAYLTERRRQKASLRVAAIAFECQEGMLITDARSVILQANQSFLQASGYAPHEVLGHTPHFLVAPPEDTPDPAPAPAADYAPAQNLQRREWHRRKSGETYPVWTTLSPVRDPHGRITHYVLTMTDITGLHEQEERRRQMEQAHRAALVQEVHHRIKNNLQGVIGMLRALDHKHPRLHGPINQVIGQVHSIAVIHGLQGSTAADRVRLGDLICAVAGGIESLWDTPIHVDTPAWWKACHIAPAEAVPVALVLNELILNAVKHGGKSQQDVRIRLHDGPQEGGVQITIANPGRWPDPIKPSQGGLGLVAALMPRSGARMVRTQEGVWAILQLDLAPPVIHLEAGESP